MALSRGEPPADRSMGDTRRRVNPFAPCKAGAKQKAPPHGRALSPNVTSGLHFLFVFAHALVVVMATHVHLHRGVVARQHANAAAPEGAFADARGADRGCTELDAGASEFGFRRRAAEQRSARQQAGENEKFAHMEIIPVGENAPLRHWNSKISSKMRRGGPGSRGSEPNLLLQCGRRRP